MIIQAWNRHEIETTAPPEGAILISIRNAGYDKAKVPEGYIDVKHLCFDDVEAKDDNAFTDTMATRILFFVKSHLKNEDVKRIIVNCHAGLSRSVGVAAALSLLLNKNDQEYFKLFPNRHVYRTILNMNEKYRIIEV